MAPVLQDQFAIDQHVQHAGGVLVWFLKRRIVDDPVRIENDDVRIVAFAQFSAAKCPLWMALTTMPFSRATCSVTGYFTSLL